MPAVSSNRLIVNRLPSFSLSSEFVYNMSMTNLCIFMLKKCVIYIESTWSKPTAPGSAFVRSDSGLRWCSVFGHDMWIASKSWSPQAEGDESCHTRGQWNCMISYDDISYRVLIFHDISFYVLGLLLWHNIFWQESSGAMGLWEKNFIS